MYVSCSPSIYYTSHTADTLQMLNKCWSWTEGFEMSLNQQSEGWFKSQYLSLIYPLFSLASNSVIIKCMCNAKSFSYCSFQILKYMSKKEMAQKVNKSICNVGDPGSIPG